MKKEAAKGITYRKDRKKWQAQIKVDNKNINLGLFKFRNEAIERYKAVKNAVDEGIPIREFLEANPNKKNYHSTINTFENDYNSWLDDIEREPSSKDGYHFK